METVTKVKKKPAFFSKTTGTFYSGPYAPNLSRQDIVIENDAQIEYSPYRVPNWKVKVRTRNNASSYLHVSSRKTTITSGGMSYTVAKLPGYPDWYPYTTVAWGALVTPPYVNRQSPGNIPAKVHNQAVTRFLRKCQEAQRQLQSLVAYGERRDTVRTLTSAGKAMKSGVKGLLETFRRDRPKFNKRPKRGSLGKDTSAATDYLSEKWLEFSFGVKPLVSDIASASRALAELVGDVYRQPSVQVRAGADFDEEPTYFGSSGDVVVGTYRYSYDWYRQDKFDVKYYGAVVIDPNEVDTSRVLGLNLGSFVPSMWELIPYSFLVDYFTNIGDIIEATCNGAGGLAWVNRGTKATRTVYNTNGQMHTSGVGWPASAAGGPGGCRDVVQILDRSPVTASDLVPSFEWQVPHSPTQWVNMLALGVLHRKLIPFMSK